jgi:hypothetical protein
LAIRPGRLLLRVGGLEGTGIITGPATGVITRNKARDLRRVYFGASLFWRLRRIWLWLRDPLENGYPFGSHLNKVEPVRHLG